MKKIYLIILVLLLSIDATVFAEDVSIDINGNTVIGTSNSNANFEVTGASTEDAIVGVASGTGTAGVYGSRSDNSNYGILGYDSYGVFGYSESGYAGYFDGNTHITGNLTVGGSIGYTETDPVFSAWDKSTGISIIESQITDLDHFTNVDETDPLFSVWDKSTGISITESQITDLNHFTNADETDPLFSSWDKSTDIQIAESQIIDIDKYSSAEVDAMIASLNARIAALENPSENKHWDVPRSVGTGYSPQVSSDSSGNAIAVWQQYNGSISDIYAKRYVAGMGWSTAEVIETGTGNAYSPQISFDSSGNAIAVWRQYNGSDDLIYANRYVAGSGWGTAEVIDAGTGDSYSPQISVDSSGNAVAVWWQYNGSTYDIYANRFVASTGWGTAEVIETGTGSAYSPQISVDNSGNAIAVWEQFSGPSYDIYASRFVAGSGWGTAEVIETGTGSAYSPQVGFDSSGNAIAVWQQYTGSIRDIYASRYVDGIGWGTAEVIETITGDSYSPQISFDSSGNAIAVWEQSSGSADLIYANRYAAGIGWGTAEVIETGTENAYSPQISVNSSGNAIAVWEQYSGSADLIYSNRYVAGLGWGTAEVIEAGTGDSYSAQISLDSNGNAIAVWEQYTGSGDLIYANRFW